MDAERDRLSRLIAQEGGKPLVDAIVETSRAIDGVRNAAEELRNFAGRAIPMGLTAASTGRWAFTIKEPIGVVVALSAFNHPQTARASWWVAIGSRPPPFVRRWW